MDNKLYLSITHYDDPKQTIFRQVYTSFLRAVSPISLRCKVEKHKYRDYKPTLLEVFTLDLENNLIIPLSKDDMTPPTESQIENIKGICEVLGRVYNEPETKVYASSWIAYYMTKYNEKINETLDKEKKILPTENQISYIKGICELL